MSIRSRFIPLALAAVMVWQLVQREREATQTVGLGVVIESAMESSRSLIEAGLAASADGDTRERTRTGAVIE